MRRVPSVDGLTGANRAVSEADRNLIFHHDYYAAPASNPGVRIRLFFGHSNNRSSSYGDSRFHDTHDGWATSGLSWPFRRTVFGSLAEL